MIDWQASYPGVSMGPGSYVGIVSLEGLEDLPEVRSGDSTYARNDGVIPGLDFMGGRTFTATLEIVANTGWTVAQTIEHVQSGFQINRDTEQPFAYQLPGTVSKVINCRVRKRSTPIDLAYSGGIARMVVQFFASDPRKYAGTSYSTNLFLPTPSSGVAFPATFPLTFGGTTGGGGIAYVTNDGNTNTFPTAFIYGPCINPRLQNTTTGETLGLTITLGSSDYIEVDFASHTVKLNGSGYRPAAVTTPGWFSLGAGNSQVAFFSSDASPTGATTYLEWTSAWA